MKFIFGNNSSKLPDSNHVVTIGNFDGLHRGHLQIINELARMGKDTNLPVLVISFEPLPREFLAKENDTEAPSRVMSLRQKMNILESKGVDVFWCLKFSDIRKMLPKNFIEEILIKGAKVSQLFIGDDFRFGSDRSGDYSSLEAAGRNYGFKVKRAETLQFNHRRISSSWIRQLLLENDFDSASYLLGRQFEISGKVCIGNKVARTFGFPTANVRIFQKPAIFGVFAAKVKLESGEIFNSVVNIGKRPSIESKGVWMEAHLHDFCRQIYGEYITVRPIYFLRREMVFQSLSDLKAQIFFDDERARSLMS